MHIYCKIIVTVTSGDDDTISHPFGTSRDIYLYCTVNSIKSLKWNRIISQTSLYTLRLCTSHVYFLFCFVFRCDLLSESFMCEQRCSIRRLWVVTSVEFDFFLLMID